MVGIVNDVLLFFFFFKVGYNIKILKAVYHKAESY